MSDEAASLVLGLGLMATFALIVIAPLMGHDYWMDEKEEAFAQCVILNDTLAGAIDDCFYEFDVEDRSALITRLEQLGYERNAGS